MNPIGLETIFLSVWRSMGLISLSTSRREPYLVVPRSIDFLSPLPRFPRSRHRGAGETHRSPHTVLAHGIYLYGMQSPLILASSDDGLLQPALDAFCHWLTEAPRVRGCNRLEPTGRLWLCKDRLGRESYFGTMVVPGSLSTSGLAINFLRQMLMMGGVDG